MDLSSAMQEMNISSTAGTSLAVDQSDSNVMQAALLSALMSDVRSRLDKDTAVPKDDASHLGGLITTVDKIDMIPYERSAEIGVAESGAHSVAASLAAKLKEVASVYRSLNAVFDLKSARRFSAMGYLSRQQFQQSQDSMDLDNEILSFDTALRLTPPTDSVFHTCVHDYMIALISRYNLLGDLTDIDVAISAVQRAITLTSNDDVHMPLALHNLGALFKDRFDRSKSLKDIENSISAQQLAISLAPAGYTIAHEISNNLGISLRSRFSITRDLKDINASVSELQKAVYITPEGDKKISNILLNLCHSLRVRFESTWDITDADLAISAIQRAIMMTPKLDVSKAACLDELGTTFLSRYYYTGALLDIDQAVSAHRQAVNMTEKGNGALPRWLSNLGNAFLNRCERMSSIQDGDDAISACTQAIELSREGSTDLPNIQNNLGSAMLSRYLCDMNDAYIVRAMAAFRKGLDTCCQDDIAFYRLLNNLGKALIIQFENTGNTELAEKAIEMQRRAAELVPDGSLGKPRIFEHLGDSFQSRFQKTHDILDINAAIDAYRKAEYAASEGHPRLKLILGTLGEALLRRFGIKHGFDDVEEAITVLEKAIQLHFSFESDNMAMYLDSQGRAFRYRFENSQHLEDIEKSISAHKRSVNLTPKNDKYLHLRLQSLGLSLDARAKYTGDLTDYGVAISTHQDALSITSPGHDNVHHMINIATSLVNRYQRTWEISDLDEAINIQRKALHLLPEGHSDFGSHLYNLSQTLLYRAEHTGEMRDLEEAAILSQQGLDLIPEDDILRPSRLANLATSLLVRFEHSQDPVDIEKSVMLLQKAVGNISTGHADPIILHFLGLSLLRRFEHTGSIKDIDGAISAHRESIKSTPEGHSSLLLYFSALGECLQKRFGYTGEASSVEEAISVCNKVLDLVPPGHHGVPSMRINLGNAYKFQYMRSGDMEKLQASSEQYRLAAIYPHGAPSVRLDAARFWARSCVFFDQSQPLVAYGICLELLPQVAWLGYTIDSRHSHLGSHVTAEIPSEAAAAAISLGGSIEKALEWLEQGRSIVWNQLNNLRTPFELVREKNASLAHDLLRVSKALESAGYGRYSVVPLDLGTEQLISMDEETQSRHRLADEWDALLCRVREISGFENFLRSMKFSELTKSLPSSGPVVVINVHEIQCDAIILIHGRMHALHVPLSKLSYGKAQELQKSLGSCLTSAGRQTRDSRHVKQVVRNKSEGLANILFDLWVLIVKPVLDVLHIQPSDKPSRIWWCATGPLAFLPLHAAGIYSKKEKGHKISDFVISSYSPTVSAILNNRENRRTASEFRGLLAVSQPNTPGQIPLPSTEEEIRHIRNSFSAENMQIDCLDGASATVGNVIEGMKSHSWVHLACHASQDVKEPIRSAFFLHDGPLALSTIIKDPLPHAEFAFLSACQTGAGDRKLSDEAVHLAAGMLSAGYRSVIATMWSIQDEDAPRVAEVVYSRLLHEHQGEPRYDEAANALHYAISSLREKLGSSEESLLSWVPFIHVGL